MNYGSKYRELLERKYAEYYTYLLMSDKLEETINGFHDRATMLYDELHHQMIDTAPVEIYQIMDEQQTEELGLEEDRIVEEDFQRFVYQEVVKDFQIICDHYYEMYETMEKH